MSKIERDCFEKGLLKKIPIDLQKASNSLSIAAKKLEDAKTASDAHLFDLSLIASYTVMFHASRALLFKDGIKERSHYCVCLYIKEKYRGLIEEKYLHELDVLRDQRHRTLYGDEDVILKEVQETECQNALLLCEGFLKTVKKFFEK